MIPVVVLQCQIIFDVSASNIVLVYMLHRFMNEFCHYLQISTIYFVNRLHKWNYISLMLNDFLKTVKIFTSVN